MLRLNLKRFEDVLEGAVRDTGEDLERHLVGVFDDPVWQWPANTKRKGGQTVGSPRNVVDSGDLRGSQTLDNTARFALEFEWSVPYATTVFEGHGSSPARNVPLVGLREFNFPTKFAAKVRATL